MIFTSFEYVFFFLGVLLIRACLRSFNGEKWLLLVASYLFYISWSVPCGFLILFTSLFDFYIGRFLGRIENASRRRWLLAASLFVNLGMLGFFKYANFFIDNAGAGLGLIGIHIDRRHYEILLPAGISFFTFQSMSYTIDVYRRQLPPCTSVRDFLLFVAFFPQLVAGPIVRAADFLPQLLQRVRATALDFEIGLAQFCLGAVKKLVISDQVAPHVDLIFRSPASFDGLTLLQGALGYTVQIYCDFSGYSDMAIGSARMMGFRFMENFQMPYSAVTITEFWHRWHISLSTWLRDYLYIPLGGNRKGTARTYINVMVTMLLGGLWHGASWNFVVWGGLHGLCLAVHKGWTLWNPVQKLGSSTLRCAWRILSHGLTLAVVVLGWIFFRADSIGGALTYVGRVLEWNRDGTRLISPYILPAVAAVFLVHCFVGKNRLWAEEMPARAPAFRLLAYSCVALLLACLAATDAAPFIYFQF